MLYVITGVRGSGKTTLLEAVRERDVGLILQPSTSRQPRFEGEAEYEFVASWSVDRYAWSIKVGVYDYGMRWSEIRRSDESAAFTVFEPNAIQVFYNYRRCFRVNALVIGLDTVANLAEQHSRVGGDAARMMTAEQFATAVARVREADVTIEGDRGAVLAAIGELVTGS